MTTKIFTAMAITAMIGFASTAYAHCGACGVGDSKDHSHEDKHHSHSHDENKMKSKHYSYTFNTIEGEEMKLADFQGKVVLMVNTASKCGFTKQYAGLEELYRKYKDKGLVVVGFPANNFGNQEPGSNEEIMQFCEINYGVTFPMMAKISVKGEDIHPLYDHLTNKSEFAGDIKWNFTKFLLDKDGNPVARFESSIKPMSDEIVNKIEELL